MDEQDSPENRLATEIVDAAFHLYHDLGPGLLESAYEAVFSYELLRRGLLVEQQVPVPLVWKGMMVKECFRADLVVEKTLLVELKSVAQLAPVHKKQTLTYLRLLNLKLGILINFGAGTFREAISRVANHL